MLVTPYRWALVITDFLLALTTVDSDVDAGGRRSLWDKKRVLLQELLVAGKTNKTTSCALYITKERCHALRTSLFKKLNAEYAEK